VTSSNPQSSPKGVPPDALAITYVRTELLKPDKGNPRTHPKTQIEQIKRSIQVKWTNPILVDEDNGIIAGHGRLLAAKGLAMETVPVIVLSGLTRAQKRVLMLADNKIALGSGWDLDLLKIELEAIEFEGLDLDLTGFSVGEIDAIRADVADPDDDVVPAVPVEAVSQKGNIWLAGHHRIACGDVRDAEIMEALLAGAKVDAAFLDPPFNVAINGHAGGKGKIKHREFAFASGEMSSPEFEAFLVETLTVCAAASRDGAVHFVCMDHRHADELIAAGAKVYGTRLNIAVWNKSNAGMGSLYRSKHELVFVYRVGKAQHMNNVELGRHGRNRTNVWDYASVNTVAGSRRQDLELHPTVKPTSLVADALQDVTRRGDLILDAFLGSGTTLIAAERVGRRFVGLDIDPIYVDVALERWAAMTGLDPILEETGETMAQVRGRRT